MGVRVYDFAYDFRKGQFLMSTIVFYHQRYRRLYKWECTRKSVLFLKLLLMRVQSALMQGL
jgi:hypothetical protein